MKLLATNTFVPRGNAEWVDGCVIVLADVLYYGPVKDQAEYVRLDNEMKEKREYIKKERQRSNHRELLMYCAPYRYARRRVNEIKELISHLPRVEVWRREYKVLGRTHDPTEARRIIVNSRRMGAA